MATVSHNKEMWDKLREIFPDIPKECTRLVLTFEIDGLVSAEADFYPTASADVQELPKDGK